MSESNVVPFTGITKADLPVDYILARASEADLSECVVVGFDSSGNEYFASSRADAAQVIYHLQRAIWALNRLIDSEIDDDRDG